MTQKILYIHGFASTGGGPKVEQLRAITGAEVIAPTLSHRPAEDIARLARIVMDEKVTAVLGTSLGGFYAIYLAQRFDLNLVVINPALTPYNALREKIGTVRVYDTDTTFEWTERSIEELRSIGETVQVALGPKSDVVWKNALLLVAEHDELLPYGDTLKAMPWAKQVIDRVQEHRFGDLLPHADVIRAAVSAPISAADVPDLG